MENMWDKRYSQEEYVYGKEPNFFFKEHLLNYKPGKILLPAEGEGRNAVFAALSGWEVTAFDNSRVGQEKAMKLANELNVKVSYKIASYGDVNFEEETFDMIAFVYAHTFNREQVHHKMLSYLKPGGIIILEGFSKEQINNNTGGPGNIDMLYSNDEIQSDFKTLSEKKVWMEEINLDESPFHSGVASVIRLIGAK